MARPVISAAWPDHDRLNRIKARTTLPGKSLKKNSSCAKRRRSFLPRMRRTWVVNVRARITGKPVRLCGVMYLGLDDRSAIAQDGRDHGNVDCSNMGASVRGRNEKTADRLRSSSLGRVAVVKRWTALTDVPASEFGSPQ